MDILKKYGTCFINKIKMRNVQKNTTLRTLLLKTRVENSKPADVIKMSTVFVYLRRKKGKPLLEIILRTNQKKNRTNWI